MRFIDELRQIWIRLTYWPVACSGCKGTGICLVNNPGPPIEPHSCCGDCRRITVPRSEVPAGFTPPRYDPVTIGDGKMWRRPWSREEVLRPR